MAKDWEKKWEKMDPWERNVRMRNMSDFYGIDPGAQGSNRRPGANYSGEDVKSQHDIQRELNNAMASGPVADYLRYSGNRDLPHANDGGAMYALHKEMEKAHKKNPDGDSGGSFNNLSDIYGLSQKAFGKWEQDLLDKIDKGAPKEEVEKPKEPAKPKEVSMPYHVAQSMAYIDTFHANEGDRFNPGRTRGEFAQKLKDDYVGRLTQYSGTYKDGEQPWLKGPVAEGSDDMQQQTAVMPYMAPGIAGLY